MNLNNIAKEVIAIEANEIASLSKRLTEDFGMAVNAVKEAEGKLIVSGMGKSGLIGRKIAATLASTGTPSFFLHPGEAFHGDLGMIEKQDVVMLISYSGETDEVLQILPFLRDRGNITISMTGKPSSTLAKNTNYHIDISVQNEACPLQLAPTSSTTATLVMGDALAVALMRLKNFRDNDFAQFHPGGSLGRRLLTKVCDVMSKDSLPINDKKDNLTNVMHQISRNGLGLTIICEHGTVIGIITDGDLRKAMERKRSLFFDLTAFDIMTKNPKVILEHTMLVEAKSIMEARKINSLVVINESKKLTGIVTYKNTI